MTKWDYRMASTFIQLTKTLNITNKAIYTVYIHYGHTLYSVLIDTLRKYGQCDKIICQVSLSKNLTKKKLTKNGAEQGFIMCFTS